MKKLIVVDCCMRDESRTHRILTPVVEALSERYEVETIDVPSLGLKAVDRDILAERNGGVVPQHIVDMSRRIAKADRLVIAAPFWDMSFPSVLKVFFENMSLFNITFADAGDTCVGLCECQRVMYITTRGMDIATGTPLEQATPYLRALSHLWGLGEVDVIAAQNMDYVSEEEINEKISHAVKDALILCKEF